MPNYKYIACPFCDEAEIEYITFAFNIRTSRGRTWTGSAERGIITQDCPKCGKDKEEIQKKLAKKGILKPI